MQYAVTYSRSGYVLPKLWKLWVLKIPLGGRFSTEIIQFRALGENGPPTSQVLWHFLNESIKHFLSNRILVTSLPLHSKYHVGYTVYQ